MPTRPRAGKKLATALLPLLLIVAVALVGISLWLVAGATSPPRKPYLVTPEKFAQLSDRGLRAVEEKWTNRDGTTARGWLLRGDEGAPALVLLHHYGADRSWLLNLGVKVNEATNMTVLLPDLRGHGMDPPVTWTGFGDVEGADGVAAVEYLRTLQSKQGGPLVGESIGFYGVGLGAYAALAAAAREPRIKALALDSVPASPDEVLAGAVTTATGFDTGLFRLLARVGVRAYFTGSYENRAACELAAAVRDARILLLSGEDAGALKSSTGQLVGCFSPPSQVTQQLGLPVTGISAASATPEQGEAYDRRVIEFVDAALRASP
jgi:pimeloyl-ACP methyl ester carboxylesterase